MKACTVAQMRELDRRAIEDHGIPEEILMENAGLSVAAAICQEGGENRFAVFCGSGNNGGDGLVAARKLHSLGAEVEVLLTAKGEKFRGASRLNWRILRTLDVRVREAVNRGTAGAALRRCDTVVDAIFGTGLARPVEGPHRDAINLINRSGKRVVSVDIPSGIHGDTGAVMGIAVAADFTVTFGLPKIGCLLYPGYECCGRLVVSHISFPPILTETADLHAEINVLPPLPARDPSAHKRSVGDALFVAGASGYYGAPAFAALSFLKAGGGYARLAAPRSIIPAIAARAGEIVFVPQRETESGSLAAENEEELVALCSKVDFVIIGPGTSRAPATAELIRRLAVRVARPIIVDGDGLTAVAGRPDLLRRRRAATLLTPHPGEMGGLLSRSVKAIQADRVGAAVKAAKEYRAFVALKGAHTVVAAPSGEIWINMSGNSGMATAGAGDVLSGTAAAMLAQGLDPPDALRSAVYLHGLAGDLAADRLGKDGITAGDILAHLPPALKRYREDYDTLVRDCCGRIRSI